ncbi:MAG: hypothetical protein AB7U30_03040 [Sulfuricellaceae bacterium]|jgi:hypothetical protein
MSIIWDMVTGEMEISESGRGEDVTPERGLPQPRFEMPRLMERIEERRPERRPPSVPVPPEGAGEKHQPIVRH